MVHSSHSGSVRHFFLTASDTADALAFRLRHRNCCVANGWQGMASDRHLLLTSLWADSNNTSGLALGNRWKIGKTMRLNLGRRLCWCATCLQSKVKVRKTHKSSLLRKRSEFTLRPHLTSSCTTQRRAAVARFNAKRGRFFRSVSLTCNPFYVEW